MSAEAIGEREVDWNWREGLSLHGQGRPRAVALAVAAAGLQASNVRPVIDRLMSWNGETLRIGELCLDIAPGARVVVMGAGKASYEIAAGLEELLGDRIDGGLVIVPEQEGRRLSRIETMCGDHPLPTERSLAAGEALWAMAGPLGPDDLVLACFTGGSSAMAAMCPAGITLHDKRQLTKALLRSGRPVVDMNVVRKHVSAFKGGRLAREIFPARIVNLTVSDVAGDMLDAITDPTVQDSSTAADAIRVLRSAQLWDQLPCAITEFLAGAEATSPVLDGEIHTVLLVNGESVCTAMAAEAARLGWRPVTLSTSFMGEAQVLGSLLADLARNSFVRDEPFPRPCVLIGCGGESTVTMSSDNALGAGGPNQEATLAAALAIPNGHEIAAVFIDTDGRDGGTAIAGGIADGLTRHRARQRDLDLRDALAAHHASSMLEALGDQIITGSTGTNVNDLFAIAVGKTVNPTYDHESAAPEQGSRSSEGEENW